MRRILAQLAAVLLAVLVLAAAAASPALAAGATSAANIPRSAVWWHRSDARIPICHAEGERYVVLWVAPLELLAYLHFRLDIIPEPIWGCPAHPPGSCAGAGLPCRDVPEVPATGALVGAVAAGAGLTLAYRMARRRRARRAV